MQPGKRFLVWLAGLSVLGFLATDMYLPAFAAIQADLQTPASAVSASLSLFLAGFAAAQLLWGPLSDRYGRKPVLLIGLTIFALGSLGMLWVENAATLLVSGRDVEYQELTLQFNDLVWELVERKNSEDIHKAELPKFLFRVVDFMERRTEWVGTATELLTEMGEQEVTPNMVTKYLGQFAYEVLEPLGIEYRTKRTGKSRLIKFLRRDSDDANDAGIAI